MRVVGRVEWWCAFLRWLCLSLPRGETRAVYAASDMHTAAAYHAAFPSPTGER